jgi:hypothetical protein
MHSLIVAAENSESFVGCSALRVVIDEMLVDDNKINTNKKLLLYSIINDLSQQLTTVAFDTCVYFMNNQQCLQEYQQKESTACILSCLGMDVHYIIYKSIALKMALFSFLLNAILLCYKCCYYYLFIFKLVNT